MGVPESRENLHLQPMRISQLGTRNLEVTVWGIPRGVDGGEKVGHRERAPRPPRAQR